MEDNDIEEGIITKINLDREWALGQFCHRNIFHTHLLTLKIEQKLLITFITGDITYVNK